MLPLNLGMIAAFYAARYTTLEIFAGSMRPRLRIREVLEVLCAASNLSRVMSAVFDRVMDGGYAS